jgi:hypothetical protein
LGKWEKGNQTKTSKKKFVFSREQKAPLEAASLAG